MRAEERLDAPADPREECRELGSAVVDHLPRAGVADFVRQAGRAGDPEVGVEAGHGKGSRKALGERTCRTGAMVAGVTARGRIQPLVAPATPCSTHGRHAHRDPAERVAEDAGAEHEFAGHDAERDAGERGGRQHRPEDEDHSGDRGERVCPQGHAREERGPDERDEQAEHHDFPGAQVADQDAIAVGGRREEPDEHDRGADRQARRTRPR